MNDNRISHGLAFHHHHHHHHIMTCHNNGLGTHAEAEQYAVCVTLRLHHKTKTIGL